MSTIQIKTNKPVAFDSPDHIMPFGTANDNSLNLRFNEKLFRLIPKFELSVLDLGCAGGGFVKSILDSGGFAIGIEGSDYSKKIKRAEWKTIPDYLFTADITELFQLFQVAQDGREQELKFNFITAWEVLEHICENQLFSVFQNIKRHLSPGGIIIVSITAAYGAVGGIQLHQTIKNKKWWLTKILELGFINHKAAVCYFGSDWVRGGYDNPSTPSQFHFVLTRFDERKIFKVKLKSLPFLIKFQIYANNLKTLLISLKIIIGRITPRSIKIVYRIILKFCYGPR